MKGSGSGESRACKFSQRLAVVLESDIGGDVLQLQVPAASLFGPAEGENMPLKAYANWLGAQNISPDEVVTRMKFDTKAQSPKLFFRPVRWLDDDEHDIVLEKGSSEEAKKAVTMTVAKTDKAPDAPMLEAPKKPKAKEPVEDDVDEPEVRQEKAAPAPNKRNNLASVVADWDTDD
jgi:UDP-N-acetylmuramyl pentapeptide synthase